MKEKQEKRRMEKSFSLEQYLEGKSPLQPERLALPTDEELDAAEAEFDRIVCERNDETRKKKPATKRLLRWWPIAAAAVVAFAFILAPHSKDKEVIAPTVVTTTQPSQASLVTTPHINTPTNVNPPKNEKAPRIVERKQQTATIPAKAISEPSIPTRTDSLEYYITRLEAEMNAIGDSVSRAHMERLIAADARLQQLVDRIIHGEVEQAMNTAADSTSEYINF